MHSRPTLTDQEPVLGITGSSGFLGWHLAARARALGGFKIVSAPRETFCNRDMLLSFVRSCDTIVHLAGVNRGNGQEIEQINIDLCRQLAAACDASQRDTLVIFANSIHVTRDTAYGRSKRWGAEHLGSMAVRGGYRFFDLVLPQLFGECGRPFYNSVVATFCNQLAVGQPTQILEDSQLELVHAQEVASLILQAAKNGRTGRCFVPGRKMSVRELLIRLKSIADCYNRHVIPDLDDGFDLDLFNTYRSYRFPAQYPVAIDLRSDSRGRLFEGVRSLHGGQCFFSTTKSGITRGNHYHLRKFERFLVLSGEAIIRIRKLLSNDVTEYRVSGEQPAYVDMPTIHTHNITNIGKKDLVTMFWAHEIYDANRPDTYPEQVSL